MWCALAEPDEHFYDHGLANDTIARLRFAAAQKQPDGATRRPFFIQSGFARPHTPWRVPAQEHMRMRRFYARAGRVPPGDCAAFGGSGGASPALAFLLLLVLLSLRPCFLSCLSDVLRHAHVHGCVGGQAQSGTRVSLMWQSQTHCTTHLSTCT